MEDGKNGNSSRTENKEIQKYGRQRTCSGTMSSTSAASTISTASQNRRKEGNQKKRASCSSWEGFTHHLRKPIVTLLHMITSVSAHDPKLTIAVSVLLGCCMIMVGASTNFHVVVEQMTLWTPLGSKPQEHQQWRDNASGFPPQPREVILAFHANGDNVLGHEQIHRMFVALDAIRNIPGYDELCRQTDYVDAHNKNTCKIHGVTRFFAHSSQIFESQVFNDEETIAAISAPFYPDGSPVNEYDVFGHPVRDANGTLVSAQLYFSVIELPAVAETEIFEKALLDVVIDDIRVEWQQEQGNTFRLEGQTSRTFSDEFIRAIEDDITLLPIVFMVMGVFTCTVFWKRDKVQSRTMLGFGAVISVLLAVLSGYGLMFASGVPFTSMTPLLPFILCGIGLDDSFIISGSFERTDRNKPVEERIYDTFEECGLSITLTTTTSALAFALGCVSSIPAIYWLSLYAFPTVVFILLYQLTFFTSFIVLDERRIAANRRDCCFCVSVEPPTKTENVPDTEQSESDSDEEGCPRRLHKQAPSPISERLMTWYAKQLLRPVVKIAVLVAFAALSVACATSASGVKQEFNYIKILPSDSYALGFYNAVQAYSVRSPVLPYAYFRNVDQSDEDVQQQMQEYIDELVETDSIIHSPAFFWLNDFQEFVNNSSIQFFGELSFNEQLTLFLADPVYNQLYANDIVRDKNGNIAASRAMILMDNVDFQSVQNQINALFDQREVTRSQPINKGRSNWAFFLYDEVFNYWELYARSVDELLFTTIMGLVSVTFLSLILIPHWTAAAFVLPILILLYVDLLGVLGWAGVKINPVTFIALVLSIGLMVDYLMHVLLRYYECTGTRKERTIEALRTMGSSILVGGITTFLGTMPLAFSSSEIFMTIFYSFLGLVTLGAGHGLILLPVILSIVGPESCRSETLPTILEEDHSLELGEEQ